MSINKKTLSTGIYNNLVEGKEGLLQAIGSTMQLAFSLFQSKELDVIKKLQVNGFIDAKNQGEKCTSFISDHAIELINSGYQSVTNKKKKLFTDIDNFKKDEPEMLRILRDALPVAMYLIDSGCPVADSEESYFTVIKNRPSKLNVSKLHLKQVKDMAKKFNADGLAIFGCSFSDLQKMANYWFFKDSEPVDSKHPVHALAEKFNELLNNKTDDETGKIKGCIGEKWGDTIKAIVKVTIQNLSQLDTEKCFEEIDEIINHIQGLSSYGNNNMAIGYRGDNEESIEVKLIGVVPFNHKQNAIVTRKIINDGKVTIDTSNLKTIPHYTKQTVNNK